jgi:DNA primase
MTPNSSPLVEEVLRKQNMYFTISGGDYLIKCLNPEHNDRSPSLRVDRMSGLMHCFACTFRGNIFSFYGIKNNVVSLKTLKLREKLRAVRDQSVDVEFPANTVPFQQVFRGIAAKTFRTLGAFTTPSMDRNLTDRLFFPVKSLEDKTVAYIGRKVNGDTSGKDKYYAYPPGTPLPMYPSVFPNRPQTVVLVEGIFDLANLLDKGLTNVSCIFGVSTLKNTAKTQLLPLRVQGVANVLLLLDSDEAGKRAMNELKPIIEAEGFGVTIGYLPEGKDPGVLTQSEVDQLKEKYKL